MIFFFLYISTLFSGVDLNRNFGFSWGDIGLMDAPQVFYVLHKKMKIKLSDDG